MRGTGYDSLVVLTDGFDVAASHRLHVRFADGVGADLEREAEYPLWPGVKGRFAFHNAEHFNVSIKPNPDRYQVGCAVQFSVPKLATGSNYQPAGERGLNDALNALQGELHSIGLNTNIENAIVCRLDACRNVVTDLPIDAYWPVMGMLKGTRMTGVDYGGTGYLWRNKSHQVAAYDKLQEMAAKKRDTSGLPDAIRFEDRNMTAKRVLTTTGIRTAGDLRTGFDAVRGGYRKALSNLFKAEVPERVVLTAEDIKRELEHFKAQNPNGHWIKAWLLAHGVTRLLEMCDMAEIKAAVRDVTGNRKTANGIAKTLEAARLDAAKLQEITPYNRSMADLYGELRGKLLDE